MTLLAGPQGVGKSSFRDDLIARITMGREFPDGAPSTGPGNVVFVSLEEDIGGVVLDRLDAAGADLERILLLNTVKREVKEIGDPAESSFQLPRDIKQLLKEVYAYARTTATPVKLFVLDPLMSALEPEYAKAGNQKIRQRVIDPLQTMLAMLGIAGIIVCHYTKSSSPDWSKRLEGNYVWAAVARSALEISYDPLNENRRLLTTLKSSNAKTRPPQMVYEKMPNGRLDYLSGLTTQEAEVRQAARYSKASDDIHAVFLADIAREYTPQEIAQMLMLPAPKVSQHIKRLLDKGVIEQTAYGRYRATALIATP